MKGEAIRQVLTFQGTDKEEIVSGGGGEWEEVGDGVGCRPDAESPREGRGKCVERKEGRRKEITKVKTKQSPKGVQR